MRGDGQLGLRERKKRETRIALSWATIRLTVERGFDNVRVEDIAAAVGVSPRTFNNYFSSKGEAIAARHLERARAIAEELRARPAAEPLWEAIENAMMGRYALGLDAPAEPDQQWTEGVRLMVEEPALQAEFIRAGAVAEAELAEAIAERTGTDVTRDLYPKLVAGAVGTAINVATEHWLRTDQPTPMAPLLREAIHQLAAGLPTP
jgi:AcrR family transcriptional regulator